MIRFNTAHRRSRGFSLIEVMIAVVVLATGLLALAALQGSLTRSSAEAKERGRVAAMLSARMDELRTSGYGTLVDGTVTTTSTTNPCNIGGATGWIDCTREQAGLASLSSTQTVTTWSGAATFAPGAPPVGAVNPAEFKRVSLTASWIDAANTPHQLALATDISALSLTINLIPPPDDQASGGANPVVRTTSPATAGVIPIALGNGSSSAASNPTPELVGQKNNEQIVGTKFNVLTYAPSGAASVIQKRFENEVIKCSCQYGQGGTKLPQIYQTAQWPAIWTGERYDLYVPTPSNTAAPGQALSSGPKSGVTQSPLCRECCRDHHDRAAATAGKFDPERSDGLVSKFNPNDAGTMLEEVPDTSSATYVNACRVIRVDGFWRTASDMYSRQFGLLETGTGSEPRATNGLPTANATTAYTHFVKNYLKQYNGAVGTAPTNAQSMFDATAGINVPPLVTISAPSTTDYRYLHGRGLYVDYLEEKARTKLVDVLADTGARGRCAQVPTPTPLEDCVLPYLPFTSANLTEIADWEASDSTVLGVNSGNLLATLPSQPSGSRTIGKKPSPPSPAPRVNNTATARKSNSGVAVSSVFNTLDGVDPTDNTEVGTDFQDFQVNGSGGSGDQFNVQVTGGGTNKFVFYVIGDDKGECIKPKKGDHACQTNSTLPVGGSVRVANYNFETTVLKAGSQVAGFNGQCSYNGSPVTVASRDIAVPALRNFYVSAASIGTAPGTIAPPPTGTDGTWAESTLVTFASIPKLPTVMITLTEQTTPPVSPILATFVSCTARLQGNTYYFDVGTWTKPWDGP